jgi:uncharacterized protein
MLAIEILGTIILVPQIGHSLPATSDVAMLPATNSQFHQLKVRYLIAAYLLIHFGLGFMLGVFGFADSFKHPDFTSIFYIVGIVITCLWTIQRCDRLEINIDRLIGDLPKQTRWLKLTGLTFAVTAFSVGSALVTFSLLQIFFPDFVNSLIADSSIKASQGNSLITQMWTFIALVMVAPTAEEFLFRGIILNRWSERWGAPKALLASSLFFGCLHPHPIGLSMFGLVMGLLYLRDKTLWTPIFCHTLNNLAAFVSMVLSGGNADRTALSNALLPNIVVGTIISAIALVFLWRFIDRNFPKKQKLTPK